MSHIVSDVINGCFYRVFWPGNKKFQKVGENEEIGVLKCSAKELKMRLDI